MNLILFVLRVLFGDSSGKADEFQPVAIRADGRSSSSRRWAVRSLWVPFIGWISLETPRSGVFGRDLAGFSGPAARRRFDRQPGTRISDSR